MEKESIIHNPQSDLRSFLKLLDDSKGINVLVNNLRNGVNPQYLCGLQDSVKAYIIAGLKRKIKQPIFILLPTIDEAEKVYGDISQFLPEEVSFFPGWEILPYETISPSPELIGERLNVLYKLLRHEPKIYVTYLKAILYKLAPPEIFGTAAISIKCRDRISPQKLLRKIMEIGYRRETMVECGGTFSQHGGIVDIFPPSSIHPVRIEFFDDEIESIREFDLNTQRSVTFLEEVELLPACEAIIQSSNHGSGEDVENIVPAYTEYFDGIEWHLPFIYPELATIFDYLPQGTITIFDEWDMYADVISRLHKETFYLYEEGQKTNPVIPHPDTFFLTLNDLSSNVEKVIYTQLLAPTNGLQNISPITVKSYGGVNGQLEIFANDVKRLHNEGYSILLIGNYEGQAERIKELVEVYNIPQGDITIKVSELSGGFLWPEIKFAVITDQEIFGRPRIRRRRRFDSSESVAISSFVDLSPNDYVVHINHGIGRYVGLTNIKIMGVIRDFLLIEYGGEDKLYVPIDQFNLVQKYIGAENNPPTINRLNDGSWEKIKNRVKRSILEMADELLKIHAARESISREPYPPDDKWQHEFEAGFVYEETPDQLKVIFEVKKNMMTSSKPIDRLICGDVGYGKTEVAIRAAFKAVMVHRQVAVLVPTTILAEQHFFTFTERLAGFPITVETLSRFKTDKDQRMVIERLKEGKVDIIIGTHRLLQPDVNFKHLGLVVIDEEQRFGVKAKERIKQLKQSVDVLTLSATPIPRTLYMAISGIREMSVINTPPPDRLAIMTFVLPFDEKIIREAIQRELEREGQIFFIHNRVQTIYKMKTYLERIYPDVRIVVGHGQMHERELRDVMIRFQNKEYDLLLATSIIESGLDIPSVNTIIIHNAHEFGLSDLYQLRGRVGRSKHRAYAYLTYPLHGDISHQAKKRLNAIQEFVQLGSGFKLAMRDLEIRGAGNILGQQQHGNMVAVGFELYCSLLKNAISSLKGEPIRTQQFTPVELLYDTYLPETYIPEISQRFAIYKRLSEITTEVELEGLRDELKDRFGRLPEPTELLIQVMELKIIAQKANVLNVTHDGKRVVLEIAPKGELAPKIVSLAMMYPQKTILNPRKPNIITVKWDGKEDFGFLKNFLSYLGS